MDRRGLRIGMIAVVLVGLTVAGLADLGTSSEAQAGCHRRSGPNDLFYNYYIPPGPYVGAQLYVCPRPTPPMVGHTYYTYQPLLPHEYMYRHHRTYCRKNPGAGWTKTRVSWYW